MPTQDLRIILAVALGVAVVVLICIMVVAARRARGYAIALHDRELELQDAQRRIAQLEPEARAATALRAELSAASSAIGQAHGERERLVLELGRLRVDGEQLRSHAAGLASDLERYRALRDAEAEQRRILDAVAQVEVTRRGAHDEIVRLQTRIAELRHELGWFEQEQYFESFGLYAPRYDFATSADYKAKLERIRDRQRELTKEGRAATCSTSWSVAGSEKAGAKMVADQLRLMLRAFNGECDAAVGKVTAQNVAAIAERIEKAFEAVNKLGVAKQCEIGKPYLKLKLEELYLFHEYRLKKEAEREEQRAIQEQMREEKRALEELERARRQVEQEERRFEQALAKARAEVDEATGEKHSALLRQIAALEGQLAEAKERERSISQAELTRAGHVYVISNIGSFGEHIYKIGMTRRLDPQERVTELGDASVPFPFDVHAIISTGDAPKLENELHRLFTARRVNAVNHRKEFFAVSLDEIEAAVHRLHGRIEFTKLAEASEYRASLVARAGTSVAPNAAPRRIAAAVQAAPA